MRCSAGRKQGGPDINTDILRSFSFIILKKKKNLQNNKLKHVDLSLSEDCCSQLFEYT